MPEPRPSLLAGRRILVVEDEYLIAKDTACSLNDGGAEIVGPASNVDDGLDLIEEGSRLDAAVLDINLQGEMAYAVADALLARDVPFVFATGYDASAVPAKYDAVICFEKPIEVHKVGRALFGR